MKNITGISISLALIIFLTLGTAYGATSTITKLSIKNPDDDNLWVKLSVDGVYLRGAMVSQNTTKYIVYYKFSVGSHELKIEWKDPDTCQWWEKTKTVEITDEVSEVTIDVLANSEVTCKDILTVKQATKKAGLAISVRNRDDDTVFITLYVDKDKRAGRTVSGNGTALLSRLYSMNPGTHEVRIRWKEPDTGEWHERTQEIQVEEGDNSITLETDSVVYTAPEPLKPNSAIDIYVKNIDDDDLWVSVYVDSATKMQYIKDDTKRHIKNFDKLHPGKHRVLIRWIDPDSKGWQERVFIVNLGYGEMLKRTFYTVKNTR